MTEKKIMTPAEAGRLGGLATRASHGAEHYAAAGKKGGRKGGVATRDRYGRDFYVKIGKKGGSVPKKRKVTE